MNVDDDPPSPPIDKRIAALKRRSSMGHSIRKSRSIIGITFEDQISAIPKTASVQEKLLQITNMAWSATQRLVQQEYEDATEDNPQADLSDHIQKNMKVGLSNTALMQMTELIDQMTSEVAASGQKPEKIIPPRLKKLHEALDVADTEIQEWKDLHDERKTMLKNAKSEMKQIVSGEKMITDEDRKLLPESEEAYLRGLSDGQGELEQVKLQEKALALAQRAQLSEMALKRKFLCEMATDTDLMMKKLKAYSEHDTLKSD